MPVCTSPTCPTASIRVGRYSGVDWVNAVWFECSVAAGPVDMPCAPQHPGLLKTLVFRALEWGMAHHRAVVCTWRQGLHRSCPRSWVGLPHHLPSCVCTCYGRRGYRHVKLVPPRLRGAGKACLIITRCPPSPQRGKGVFASSGTSNLGSDLFFGIFAFGRS